MTFRALVVEKSEDGKISQSIQTLDDSRLPAGDVTVKVEYSTLNYKDGLCLNGLGGLVRTYPHVPGVDFAGIVETSTDARFAPGDRVVLTGWRVGEAWWGGYSTRASVKADWLVKLPEGMSTRMAMAIGTAGITAMFAIMALEKAGLTPERGEVLVTGATGGVGSVAIAILAKLGYKAVGVTGRPEMADYLKSLGADGVIARSELSDPVSKPLESGRWAAAIDAVGGDMLARVLKQLKSGGAAASIGNAGSADVPSFTVIPFLLRGVSLLGIDSVMRPFPEREEAWRRLVSELPQDKLEAMISEYGLEDLPRLGNAILKGDVKGRIVIDLSR